MSYDQSKVAFIDTETTGLDPENHPVWDVAAIVDGVEHTWQQRITETGPWQETNRLGVSVDEQWAALVRSGIVDQWVLDNMDLRQRYAHRDALRPLESIARLEGLVRGRHLIGACSWFDSERLHRVQLAESDHRDLLWHYHLIDVENLAVGYLAGRRDAMADEGYPADRIDDEAGVMPTLPWKSTDLSLALGVDPADFEPKHTALADARWAKAMYEAMMGGPE